MGVRRRFGTQNKFERPPVGRFVFVYKGKSRIVGGARPRGADFAFLKMSG